MIVAAILGQWVFYPMVRWGYGKLNEFKIDDLANKSQAEYLVAVEKKNTLTKDNTDEEIKAAAKELYEKILAFHNNRKPDGLLDLK